MGDSFLEGGSDGPHELRRIPCLQNGTERQSEAHFLIGLLTDSLRERKFDNFNDSTHF